MRALIRHHPGVTEEDSNDQSPHFVLSSVLSFYLFVYLDCCVVQDGEKTVLGLGLKALSNSQVRPFEE